MDKLDKIEAKIDKLHERFDEVIVKTEGRLTSLEHKIGPVLWGVGIIFAAGCGLLLKGCGVVCGDGSVLLISIDAGAFYIRK